MNKSTVTLIGRLILGTIFLVMGLNGFLNFLPMPEISQAGMAYMGGLMSAVYFFPLLKIIEITAGVMLLTGNYMRLALILLAPITTHIVLFHFFLDPAGLVIGLVVFGLNLGLGLIHLDKFQSTLSKSWD